MTCLCDIHDFPPHSSIRGSLPWVPLQFATYPEFRQAMLAEIPSKPALAHWRARETGDFGLMMLDWWAWLSDNVSFYDEVHSNEFLLRCAQQRSDLRKLTGLLGYRPRPAISAMVELALLLDGHKPVLIPAGTAFRSGSFPGGTPQVFETRKDFTLDPRANRWPLERVRRSTLDAPGAFTPVNRESLLVAPSSLRVKQGDGVLLRIQGVREDARTAASISDTKESDGETYKSIEWNVPLQGWNGSTPLHNIQLLRPTRQAQLLPPPNVVAATGTVFTYVALDGVYGDIYQGNLVMLEYDGEFRWARVAYRVDADTTLVPSSVSEVTDGGGAVISKVTIPAVMKQCTYLFFSHGWNSAAASAPGAPAWPATLDSASMTVHYRMETAAVVTAPYTVEVIPGDPLIAAMPFEKPDAPPTLVHIEDGDGGGERLGMQLQGRKLVPQAGADLLEPHRTPLAALGNIVTAVRGETVLNEVLGAGDSRIAQQSFTLKKKPLAYESAPAGFVSTLTVRVAGVLWQEVPTFYGVDPKASVFIVRQNDQEESTITFQRRLPTGAIATASYRWGAGALAPPAGSIHQLARPVRGLRSARHIVVPWGGADPEPSSEIRKYAPRSALLLGRAISLVDMEAAARLPGTRAVAANWRWSPTAQRPLVHIDYIGPSALAPQIRATLRQWSDGETPVEAQPAQPVSLGLSLGVQCDPKFVPETVAENVRIALTSTENGMLAPENVGIGQMLIRSRLFAEVLAVTGVVAVESVFLDGAMWFDWGVMPGSGKYFDFEQTPPLVTAKA